MTAQIQTPRPKSTSLFSPASELTKLADDPGSKRHRVNIGGSLQDLMESETTKQVTVAVIGAGQRGLVYASYALEHPELVKVIAVAEPRAHRRKVMSRLYSIPPENQYESWEPLFARGRIADALLITVLDDLHAELVSAFAPLGYHILCEKPMATSVQDCVKMVKEVELSGAGIFGIGHVLRYSPYNRAVKEVINSGVLGEIVNIQHIEPVGNQHFAHSFVRGNWKKESESTFALMAKSCHDLDILSFYLSGLTPLKVHSFGSLHHFKKSKKPAEAGDAKRCLDCAFEKDCVWSAKKIYVDGLKDEGHKWARHIVDADVLDIENVTDALKTGPYGVCVYEAGNDVVDHQVVSIEYEGGVTASMTMVAFTEAICDRGTRIQGTKGELIGDMATFTVFDFLTRTKTRHTPKSLPGNHGGGDAGLSETFFEAVSKSDQSVLGVTPEEVLNSHLLAFAAEQARKEGKVVNFQEFKDKAMA
ncbi:streptomycin biosynthesis protein StrI [Cryptococcus gattii E566]|uniref:NAD-binding Rossmann fold oxidoreductase, putative n=2 Tax=Cryptococcus gattii TaxID=37769 RepID=E6RFE9_CRYGW|nr:NAD-binding Rossmann fold oxidoreductase, putative [Cryptococcus gattii WM276]ADV25526.1 NAD-binding Rossmann fold oxidoreductase, putative [Cryptococcus gattii WM276]KIR78812.1 streptomycin biosynthesis protein StrI [Cryptococcus gattii EJB2]KIY32848.1 streptomycin biosynthesis protein StrI [Cryptococcus gattii E566]KJE05088.1 streptomycin biosynthesis protein StrI [Cryptococcus gattii NT-10]